MLIMYLLVVVAVLQVLFLMVPAAEAAVVDLSPPDLKDLVVQLVVLLHLPFQLLQVDIL